MTLWATLELTAVRTRYPHEKTDAIAADIGRTVGQIYQKAAALGLKKSPEYLASAAACRLRRGDNIGASYRFKPGLTVWNKGMKGLQHEGSKPTQFKPGSTPPNRLPVGHIRTNGEGYLDIKTAPGPHKFVPLHRWNWKQEHGAYPAKGMALIFKDGNPLNCAVSNLELISRSDLMKRNSIHNLPKELAELVQLRGALNRQINRRMKNEQ